MFDENFKKRWQELSLIEQLANIGSEVYRVKMLLDKYADDADLTHPAPESYTRAKLGIGSRTELRSGSGQSTVRGSPESVLSAGSGQTKEKSISAKSALNSAKSASYSAKSAPLENSIIRVLYLFNLTLSDPKNKGRLKEVARAKELFLDAVYNGAKEYKTTLDDLDKYFYQFALLVRMKKA
jgi:hypothetical protein